MSFFQIDIKSVGLAIGAVFTWVIAAITSNDMLLFLNFIAVISTIVYNVMRIRKERIKKDDEEVV